MANAVVVAVPEPRLRSHVDQYRQTVSDQKGRFSLRGLRGGSYTLFAWDNIDGQAYYNPEFVKSYEAQGSPLRLSEGERKPVQLNVIAAGDDQ